MFLIDKKLIFLLIIYLDQYIVTGEQLKGYYYNKSANKYFKIQESTTSTTNRPKFTFSTTESTRRNDEFKKLGLQQQSTISTTTTTTTTTNAQTINTHVTSNATNLPSLIQSTVTFNNSQSTIEQNPINQTILNTKVSIKPSNYPDHELEIERPKINMLDFMNGISKAIHLLLYQRDPSLKNGLEGQESIREENQTSTTQSISIFRPLKVNSKIPPEGLPSDYRAQAELLRQQILRRCNQLQNIIATTNEILRERENLMFVKILDNFSSRIEHTKLRADLILKEPSTSITAVKALNRMNYYLNNMNSLVQNVLSRVNVSINLDMKENQKESSKRDSKRMKDRSSKKKEIKKESEKDVEKEKVVEKLTQ